MRNGSYKNQHTEQQKKQHIEHQKTQFCVFFPIFILFSIYNFLNDFSKKCWVTALVQVFLCICYTVGVLDKHL